MSMGNSSRWFAALLRYDELRRAVFFGQIVCAAAGGRTYPARATCEQTARSCYHALKEASRKAVTGRGRDVPERNPLYAVRQRPALARASSLLADQR
jgi:hypothetical protein